LNRLRKYKKVRDTENENSKTMDSRR